MADKVSLTNESFNFLQGSSDFLNLIIHDIGSCILMLDREMMLQAYNEPLKNIFASKEKEHLLYNRCGNAIGCAYAVDEARECGSTSQCAYCELREESINSYITDKPAYKVRFDREFYTSDCRKELKHLQFSTRLFHFKKDKYIIVMIDDITHLIDQEELILQQK